MRIKILILVVIVFTVITKNASSQISIIQDIKCYGAATGSLIASPLGWGTAPYTYLWSTGETSQAIHDLPAGNYTVTITDFVAMDSIFTFDITEPTEIQINVLVITPSDCDGYDNGGITINVTGGISSYTYAWREISTDSMYSTQDISNVRGGDYEINVTDTWGCTASDTITVPNLALVPVSTTVADFVCNGAKGSIIIQADSAQFGKYYTYEWSSTYNTGNWTSNDSVFSTSTSFLPGTYVITVTENATGCANYYGFTITESETQVSVTPKVTHNKCYEDNTGRIQLYINGGDPLPNYTCSWTGPYGFASGSFTITSRPVGDYTYTVRDNAGTCTVSETVRILPLQPIQGTIGKTNATCNNADNGIAWANYSGGTGPIEYFWSTGDTINQITNLAAGTYYITITDSTGCNTADSIIISEPSAIVIVVDSTQNASCFGYNDGAIWTSASGGMGYYEYSWLKDGSIFSEVTQDITGIEAGNYTIRVIDSVHCFSTLPVTITQPTQTFFTDSVVNITCNNSSTGFWAITPSGAYNPYIAIFSTGDTISTDTVPSPYINGLSTGSYQCIIIDNNLCFNVFTKSFNQPLPMTVGLSDITPVKCKNDSTGAIILDNVHGGTQPYTYSWSNGMITSFISGVPSGIYNVTIRDSLNCVLQETYEISEPFEGIKFFADIFNTSCKQSADGRIVLFPENIYWSPYTNTFSLYDSNGVFVDQVDPGEYINDLYPGEYVGILTNQYGCSRSDTLYLESGEDDCILIPNLVTPNGDGYNDVFRIEGGCYYSEIFIIIFDDQGNKVFESEDCAFEWDPLKEAKVASNTVFYYYIKAIMNDKVYEYRSSINVNY